MNQVKVTAVLRSASYSPNHIGTDAQILMAVCARLRKRGFRPALITEQELQQCAAQESDVVLSMCRDPRSIDILRQLEDGGTMVINSAYGIGNCKRGIMAPMLTKANVGYVDSEVVITNHLVRQRLAERGITRCWVKRADFPSMHKEDITFARNADEAQRIIQEYFLRGIHTAVVDRHMEGNLVKFYGVKSTAFFRYYYPSGLDESAENLPPVYPFSVETLQQMAARAADTLDVDIYGGDCIVDSAGRITIINFNDWPSFSTCTDEAAQAIASMVYGRIKKKFKGQ